MEAKHMFCTQHYQLNHNTLFLQASKVAVNMKPWKKIFRNSFQTQTQFPRKTEEAAFGSKKYYKDNCVSLSFCEIQEIAILPYQNSLDSERAKCESVWYQLKSRIFMSPFTRTGASLDFLKSSSSCLFSTRRTKTSLSAVSRPNKFYPEIHEVDLWQV